MKLSAKWKQNMEAELFKIIFFFFISFFTINVYFSKKSTNILQNEYKLFGLEGVPISFGWVTNY